MVIQHVTGDQLREVQLRNRAAYAARIANQRPWSDYVPSMSRIRDVAGTIAGFASMGSIELAMGRGDILTPSQRRTLEAHRRNVTSIDMAPRKRTYRNNNYTRAAKRRRVTGKSTPGYGRAGVGFYGKFGKGGEEKFHDFDISGAIALLANTEEKTNICVVPQGNKEDERVGRKIRISSIAIKGIWQKEVASATTTTPLTIKWSIIQDTQTNGTTYPTLDRLQLNNITSFNNLANSQRFKTLKVGTLNLNQTGGVDTAATENWGRLHRWFSCNLKTDIVIEYDKSAIDGSVGTQRSNSIWFTVISDAIGTGSLNNAVCRIRYRD